MNCPTCDMVVADGQPICDCGALMKKVPQAAPKPRPAGLRPEGGSGKLGKPLHKLKFHGNGGDLFAMHIINMCLTAVTLGLYHCWAVAKVRRWTFSQLEFQKERFSYHGTGKEMFMGWLKVGAIYLGLMAVLFGAILTKNEFIAVLGTLFFYGALICLVPVAIVGGRKYLLSRSSLMGIRFSFRGDVKEFVKVFVPGALLTAVTLGLYAPYFQAKVQNYMVNHSYFGNTPFKSDIDGKDLFKDFVITLVLTLPTLGLSQLWYAAKQQRYYASKTTFAGARFECDVTGGQIFSQAIVSMALICFTAGLAFPWVIVRNLNFFTQHLVLKGAVDFAAIKQEAKTASSLGDGLADALDLDVGVGF